MPFEVTYEGKPKQRGDLPLDAYARQSRVGGRVGDRAISIDEQIASFHRSVPSGYYLRRIYVELDESGANEQRDGWLEVRRHILDGSSKGTMVVRVDRFSRDVASGVEAAEELVDVGARFISVYENCDVSTPEGKWMFTNLLANAALQLAQIARSWKTAIEHAHERGIYISAWPPQGYNREHGRLIVGPLKPAVVEIFTRRAAGDSWITICDAMNASEWRPDWTPRAAQVAYQRNTLSLPVRRQVDKLIDKRLEEKGVERSAWEAGRRDAKVSGLWTEITTQLQKTEVRPYWTPNSIREIVTNPVYKGTLVYKGKPTERRGRVKQPTFQVEIDDFCPALVSKELWGAANGDARPAAIRDGRTANQVASRGVASCESCGRMLVIGATTINAGKKLGLRVPILYCPGRSSSGMCAARPAIRGIELDTYLKERFREWLMARRETPGAEAVAAQERLVEAKAAFEDAAADYRDYAMPATKKAIDDNKLWQEGLAQAKALMNARKAAYEREQRATDAESLGGSDVLEMLDDYTPVELRRIFQAAFEEVRVRKAIRLGPRSQPLEQRISVRFHGGYEVPAVPVAV